MLSIALSGSLSAQTIKTVAGGNYTAGYSGDGGSATSAHLCGPRRAVTDAAGNMYIADFCNNRIRKVTPAGIISTVAGTGAAGRTGDGAAATSAAVGSPQGLAVDASGNIYIAQYDGYVRKINSAGIISTIGGTLSSSGSYADGAPATDSYFSGAADIAVDAAGVVYVVSQSDQRVIKITTSGQAYTVAGNRTAGYSGDGGQATNAKLNQPAGIALDNSGNLYIVEEQGCVVRKVNSAGIISTIAGTGSYGFASDGVAATISKLYYPTGVAVDATGAVYIANTQDNKIVKIDHAGMMHFVAGIGSCGYTGDGGNSLMASVEKPHGVSFDIHGNLIIAASANQSIRAVSYVSSAGVAQPAGERVTPTMGPNPFNSMITISGVSRGDKLSLFDLSGKKVFQSAEVTEDNVQSFRVDNQLIPGIYLALLTDKNGTKVLSQQVARE